METVVAEYIDLNSAERAVREFERRGFSIQGLTISDESRRVWRRPRSAGLRRTPGQPAHWGVLLGGTLTLVTTQLGLYVFVAPSPLTWLLLCAACLLGACLGAALSYRTDAVNPRAPRGFHLILRSDAATTKAALAYFSGHQGS
jgi:hypothetical protein